MGANERGEQKNVSQKTSRINLQYYAQYREGVISTLTLNHGNDTLLPVGASNRASLPNSLLPRGWRDGGIFEKDVRTLRFWGTERALAVAPTIQAANSNFVYSSSTQHAFKRQADSQHVAGVAIYGKLATIITGTTVRACPT